MADVSDVPIAAMPFREGAKVVESRADGSPRLGY
jgi:hypothetical protein